VRERRFWRATRAVRLSDWCGKPAAAVFGPPASADDLKSVVRTLYAIVNPEDTCGLRIRPGVTDARKRGTIGNITGRGLNTSAAKPVKPLLNMTVVLATGIGSILTRLIDWKNKPGMTGVPTKRIIGLAIARVSKASISISLNNLVLDEPSSRRWRPRGSATRRAR
jgi:hypothetical protein